MNASPWDALMRRPVVRRLPQPTAEAAESSKTQMLLYAIDQLRHVTTMRLCLETDLDSRAVWGLLKQHRKSGRVRFMCGEWSPGVSDVAALAGVDGGGAGRNCKERIAR